MELFHGTSSTALDEIFEHGLLPSKVREGKWNTGWSARDNLVYLTDYGAAYYAFFSGANMPTELAAKHVPMILKVTLEETTCLFPDEDYIWWCLKNPPTQAIEDVQAEFGHLNDPSQINPTDERWRDLDLTWEKSLTDYGTVTAYRIQPRLISGYHIGTEESFRAFGLGTTPEKPSEGVRNKFRERFRSALQNLPYQEWTPQTAPPPEQA